MQVKLIEYAYPTSTTAIRAGFGKTGCYFVSLYDSDRALFRTTVLKFFVNKQDAEQFANSLPNPFHHWHKYHNSSEITSPLLNFN